MGEQRRILCWTRMSYYMTISTSRTFRKMISIMLKISFFMFLIFPHLLMVVCRKITEKASKRAFGKQMIINSL